MIIQIKPLTICRNMTIEIRRRIELTLERTICPLKKPLQLQIAAIKKLDHHAREARKLKSRSLREGQSYNCLSSRLSSALTRELSWIGILTSRISSSHRGEKFVRTRNRQVVVKNYEHQASVGCKSGRGYAAKEISNV